jgi:hypothetical protein
LLRGPLAYLLRNRFYVGKVVFRGETLAGEQPAIVDQEIEGEAGYIKLEGSSLS